MKLHPPELLAVSLPFAPLADAGPVEACAALLTPLGLRSLAPSDPAYRGQHRGVELHHCGFVGWPLRLHRDRHDLGGNERGLERPRRDGVRQFPGGPSH